MEDSQFDPELIGVGSDGFDAGGERPRGTPAKLVVASLLLGIAVVAAFFGLSRGSEPIGERPAAQQATTEAPPTSDASSGQPESAAGIQSSPVEANAVELVAGHVELEGRVALSTFVSPFDRGGTIWIASPDGLLVRDDVPLWPGDWTHPIMFAGTDLVFMNPPDAMTLDVGMEHAPDRLITARYVIPGSAAGLIWAIDQPIANVRQVVVSSGEIHRQYELDRAITWVSAAVADGFVVTANGEQRFWSPDRGFRDLPLPSPTQSGFRHARQDNAVFISPGPMATVVDLVTEEGTDIYFDVGEGLVTEACLSPDSRHLAVAGSTGQGRLLDVEESTTIAEFTLTREFDAIGWTSTSQFIYIDESRYLVAIDVPSGDPTVIARLRYTNDLPIILTGSAASC